MNPFLVIALAVLNGGLFAGVAVDSGHALSGGVSSMTKEAARAAIVAYVFFALLSAVAVSLHWYGLATLTAFMALASFGDYLVCRWAEYE